MMQTLKRRWLAFTVTTFLGVTACAAAWFLLSEWRSSVRVKAELTRLASLNLPVDDESAAAAFRASTHDEGALAWAEILVSANDAPTRQLPLPIVGNEDLPPHIDRNVPWQDKQVAEFLDHQESVIAQVKQAAEFPRPVWQPLVFRGFETLLEPLQQARAVVRLLQLECEYAAYHQDAPRALEAIEAQQVVAEAFDWHLAFVSELVHLALLDMQYTTIQRTLYCELWNEDQVDRLLKQIATPLDFRFRWKTTLASERGMALATMESGNLARLGEAYSLVPFVTPRMIESYLDESIVWETLGAEDLNTAVSRTQQYEAAAYTGSDGWVEQLLGPALSACTQAYARSERTRRLTALALQIKAYSLRHGSWPDSLDALKEDGVNEADLCLPNGNRFFFVPGDESCELADRPRQPSESDADDDYSTSPKRQVVIIGKH
ncbi:MAG: hypothetical protein AAGF97_16245 [Planctomycetota bacterium]